MSICPHCDSKRFVFCSRLGRIRRCMNCNPPRIGFEMAIIPDPDAIPREYAWDIAEAFAKCCNQVATEMDAQELRGY